MSRVDLSGQNRMFAHICLFLVMNDDQPLRRADDDGRTGTPVREIAAWTGQRPVDAFLYIRGHLGALVIDADARRDRQAGPAGGRRLPVPVIQPCAILSR